MDFQQLGFSLSGKANTIQTADEDPILPQQEGWDKGKKTLVLDLDETLVHSSFQPVENVDIVLPVVATRTDGLGRN